VNREIRYWLNARDKPALLVNLMRELAGDSVIGFSCDLTRIDFSALSEFMVFNREEILSGEGVVVQLTHQSLKPICSTIVPNAKCVHLINEICIVTGEDIQVLIADNFHNKCISVGPLISAKFLDEIQANGILRSYMDHSAAD